MNIYFFRKLDSTYAYAFREAALHHNVRTSKLFAATIGFIGLVLCAIDRFTNSNHVLKYPGEYSQAIMFIFIASCACYLAFVISNRLDTQARVRIYKLLSALYPLVIVFSSLWITFVMQHNPSNTMSIFVLGLLSVASLWIFEELHAIAIALFILILFNGGLHYFQTDPCKLFTNYITGTCVSIFFVCISRISFSVNYNHFIQLKKIEQHNNTIVKEKEKQTEILSVVVHDLRAPVKSVQGLVNILNSMDTTAEERKEYYDMIITACDRSNKIIDDLLIAARNEEAGITLTYTCMNDLVEDIVHQYVKNKPDQRQIIYDRPVENIYACIDHLKMIRVFENLISNAIKFTKDDGVITIKMDHDNDKVYILVTDNGIGIPKDIIPYLFEKFSKAGRIGLKGEQSHGLGMSICKMIIKQHHGDITAFSEEGKFTQIKITLPRASSALLPDPFTGFCPINNTDMDVMPQVR